MREQPIRFVRLPTGTPFETVHGLVEDFPTVSFERRGAKVRGDSVIDLNAWSTAASFRAFDDTVARGITGRLVLEGDPGDPSAARAAAEVITRYQRWLNRRTSDSTSRTFDDVLAARRRHGQGDRQDALDRAVDIWRWVLRLEPEARLPLQLAALLHDSDRATVDATLGEARVDGGTARRVRELLMCRTGGLLETAETRVLDDALGLSFFSLGSGAYLDEHGPLETRRRIGSTLARLGRKARFHMGAIRLRPDVDKLLSAVVRA